MGGYIGVFFTKKTDQKKAKRRRFRSTINIKRDIGQKRPQIELEIEIPQIPQIMRLQYMYIYLLSEFSLPKL